MGVGCGSVTPGLLPSPWVLSPCHCVGRRQGCACNPPKSCCGLSGVAYEGFEECGDIHGPGSLSAVLFCGTSCPPCHPPTARGPEEALQAPVEVPVLLREARSARSCHPPASKGSVCPLNHSKEIQTMHRVQEFRTSPSPQPAIKVWPR